MSSPNLTVFPLLAIVKDSITDTETLAKPPPYIPLVGEPQSPPALLVVVTSPKSSAFPSAWSVRDAHVDSAKLKQLTFQNL